jgi:acyl-coenzyme A thioesterase PaaI-like protein
MKHTVIGKQHNSKLCFVCGLKNGAGLQASFFETDSGTLVALFTPGTEHQSYPGRLHGGIASAILDETIGRAINVGSATEVWGVTLELTMTYRRPIPLEVELRVLGRVTEEKSRYYHGTGEILLPDGEIAVSAVGKYLKAPLDKIADFDPVVNEWTVIRRDDDPQQFNF